ncbi:MAG: TIR domain-containing protein [Promethearchaeota archaeon]
MPPLKRYRIFISHAWSYNDSYNRLINMLNNAPYFDWVNYSVPSHDPLDTGTDKELYQALINQIKPTNIVIILAGMYVNYRQWIEKEIEIAQNFNKPMIGIVPRGSQRTPSAVSRVVKEMINWNTQSIVNAIRKYAI